MDLSLEYLISTLPQGFVDKPVLSPWTQVLFTKLLQVDWKTLNVDAQQEDWSTALDLFGAEIIGHTQRVSELTLRISRIFNVTGENLTQYYRGAVLHDIGKIGIPERILQKNGPLSREEWTIIRQHPVIAYEMLSSIPALVPALDIPYYHHEKWNGCGYPIGLKETEIPLPARIFSVIDVWDAITMDRPYRKAWPVDWATDYILSESEKSFDPQVVEAFTYLLETGQCNLAKST